MPLSIQDLMDKMPEAFDPEKAEGVDVVIQLHMTGDESGDWMAVIKDGVCTVEKGTADDPTLALTADGQDYIDVVMGKLDGMQAFMQGKLKLKGDMNLAMKMTNFFKMD